MSIDDKEINAVAYLLNQQASRSDRPWDQQGVYALVRRAISDDGRTPIAVAEAGRRAIDDPDAKTPAALRFAKYYPAPTSPSATPTAPAEPVCFHCSKPPAAHERICELDPHEWQPFHTGTPRPLPEWRALR